MKLIGYEWGYQCPECETKHELSGIWMEERAIVNGEEELRTRSLEEGDTLTCQECGYESEV